MSPEDYLKLYEKYITGSCTPEEEQLLLAYEDKFRMQPDYESATKEEQHMHDRVYYALVKQVSPRRVVSMSAWWWRVAAVLLIALGAGLILYYQHKPLQQQDAVAIRKIPAAPKIVPGKNTAVLTLANGAVIQLDKAGKGVLSRAGKTVIKKAADGKLIYTSNNREDLPAVVALNTISIPRGGQYQLVLPDGTHVWLNAESSLTYPTAFVGHERHVELHGEAYFEVAKNKAMPFRVTANGAKVEVLGTHFNIKAYSGENIKTTLLEGSVRLSNNQCNVTLKPGEQGVAGSANGRIAVKQVDVQEIIAWKNGYFVFRNLDIKDIMNQVARWYDVDVKYSGNLTGKDFGGIYSRQKGITELLNGLELTGLIHFEIEGRRIIVMP